MTELRVFSDISGELHLEISHPGIAQAARLSVPMFRADAPAVRELNPAVFVIIRFNDHDFAAPFTSISTDALWRDGTRQIGWLDENDSRNVLNNLVDVLAYD
jgi:hypothetical protein